MLFKIILKYLLNFHDKGKCETKLRQFFPLVSSGYTMIYVNFLWTQRYLEVGSGTVVLQKTKHRHKYFSRNLYQP